MPPQHSKFGLTDFCSCSCTVRAVSLSDSGASRYLSFPAYSVTLSMFPVSQDITWVNRCKKQLISTYHRPAAYIWKFTYVTICQCQYDPGVLYSNSFLFRRSILSVKCPGFRQERANSTMAEGLFETRQIITVIGEVGSSFRIYSY